MYYMIVCHCVVLQIDCDVSAGHWAIELGKLWPLDLKEMLKIEWDMVKIVKISILPISIHLNIVKDFENLFHALLTPKVELDMLWLLSQSQLQPRLHVWHVSHSWQVCSFTSQSQLLWDTTLRSFFCVWGDVESECNSNKNRWYDRLKSSASQPILLRFLWCKRWPSSLNLGLFT